MQHSAAWQHGATAQNMLQHCNVLHRSAACCRTVQHAASYQASPPVDHLTGSVGDCMVHVAHRVVCVAHCAQYDRSYAQCAQHLCARSLHAARCRQTRRLTTCSSCACSRTSRRYLRVRRARCASSSSFRTLPTTHPHRPTTDLPLRQVPQGPARVDGSLALPDARAPPSHRAGCARVTSKTRHAQDATGDVQHATGGVQHATDNKTAQGSARRASEVSCGVVFPRDMTRP